MCESLGLNLNKPVDADISFCVFSTRGRSNPDGWRMAWLGDDGLLRLAKEPVWTHQNEPAREIPYYSKIKPSIFISHIRMASHGGANYAPVHFIDR